MDNKHSLFAGAGKAVIDVASCLPLDGFTEVHDDLHIRALVLESDKKIVIVSVEITSMFGDTQKKMLDIIAEITGAERDNIWLTLTHCFACPHIWPSPKPGETERPRPGHKPRSAEEIARCDALAEAYFDALHRALSAAEKSKVPAALGYGKGKCAVAASRNMLTADGWWMGTDDEEACDHSLHVLRIDSVDGKAIAAMYVYGVRSCVTSRITLPEGGMMVSSDLGGNACSYIEAEMDEGFTAVFLCGPCGDQEPRYKACYDSVDRLGNIKKVDMGMAGYALLEAQAARLGDELIKTYSRIEKLADVAEIPSDRLDLVCATKKMNRDLGSQKPLKECSFEPEGEKRLTVYGLRLDDMELCGVQPEINGVTALQIGCAVATMVNGGDKCMPEAEAYEDLKYQCQNSPFMPGGAEKLRDAAIELMKDLKEGK